MDEVLRQAVIWSGDSESVLASSPFTSEHKQECRELLIGTTHLTGPEGLHVAAGQVFYLRLISGLAEVAHDLDSAFPKEAENTLPMGVEETLPCPQYVLWDQDSDSDYSASFDPMESKDNYASANAYSTELLQQYMEGVSEEW